MPRKTNPFRIGYARPSFIEGMARIFDFGGTLNRYKAPTLDEIRERRILNI